MDLNQARAALERGDFGLALEQIDPGDDSAAALEVRAAAAYGAGNFEAAVSSWEALFALHTAKGRDEEAAWAAARVAMNLLCETGLMAPVRGWTRRAERLVAGCDPGRVDALLAIASTYERLLSGDPVAARAHALRAVALGIEFGVGPASGLGQIALARLQIHDGDLHGGLELLDEVAVALMAGEYDALTTGNMYCELICAAQWLSLTDRAREWTNMMERWSHSAAQGAIHGRCRVHRAELLRVSGPAEAAEAEALRACAELAPWMRREYGWPLVELGNIRLRRGDLAGAQEAYARAHDRAWDAQPGLALLRLEQGEVGAALRLITDAVAQPADLPWKERPPFGDLRLAPLLAAQAEIAAAAGDGATVSTAAAALVAVAQRYPVPGFAAAAALAVARAALLAGDTTAAARQAQRAIEEWIELSAPYDAAVARTVLAEALETADNTVGAAREWSAAASAFADFGAELRAEAARARVNVRVPDANLAGPPDRSSATLRRLGDHWEVGFLGRAAVIADLKGLGYLRRLLAEPGREFHVLEMVAAGDLDAGLPVLDEEAKAAYRRRLVEVEDDIAEAERNHDLARQQLAGRDRDYLLAELASAVGLGGRGRATGGTAERARGAVTRSLRYALARLSALEPELGAHLDRTIRTGACCSYQPDPVAQLRWNIN